MKQENRWKPTNTHGPNTCLCLFAYGGIFKETMTTTLIAIARAAELGGIVNFRNQCLSRGIDLQGIGAGFRDWDLKIIPTHEDALIGRARSKTAQDFLKNFPSYEVLLCLDHDVIWNPPSPDGYEGDLRHVARRCAETHGIVGAMVSKKVDGEGIASLPAVDNFRPFSDDLVPAYYVGAAFTAYHRDCLQALTNVTPHCAPGFHPIFMESIADHPLKKGEKLHLSEDWTACETARKLGYPVDLTCKPRIGHIGKRVFDLISSMPDDIRAKYHDACKKAMDEKKKVKLSLLHATRGRPEKALLAHKAWTTAASGKHELEYIFSADFDDESMKNFKTPEGSKLVVSNNRLVVDAYNQALYATSDDSKIIIQVHDDIMPPLCFDELIVNALANHLEEPKLLRVSDGTKVNPDKPWLLTILVGTRKWFTDNGYFYHPGYPSVYCDDDVSKQAAMLNAIIDTDITFKHQWGGQQGDATYARAYQLDNWVAGETFHKEREKAGFPQCPQIWGYQSPGHGLLDPQSQKNGVLQ